jgi:hypothetical protein
LSATQQNKFISFLLKPCGTKFCKVYIE